MNDKGLQAEHAAAAFLIQRGLLLLATNYRCRFGEVDLVLRDGDTLVFAEVRLRSRGDFGGAAESITAAKQDKLRLTAQHYLAQFKQIPPCRFDAVLLGETGITWIPDAF